jgi:hypothetical protein
MRHLFLSHGDAEAKAAMSTDERRTMVDAHMAYADMLRERSSFIHGRPSTTCPRRRSFARVRARS